MRWHRSSSQVIPLDRDGVWDRLRDPGTWADWCGAVARAAGTCEPGGRVALRPAVPVLGLVHSWTAPPMRVLACEPRTRLVLRQGQPGGASLLHWHLSPTLDGTRLRLDVLVHGPLTPAALPVYRGFHTGFAADCRRLADVAAGAA